jgi:hypothetical protein
MRFHLSVGIVSIVFAVAGAAPATVIYENAGPISLPASTVIDSGAGNVDNGDLGTDRTLIVTFNVELTNDPENGDGWFAVGFGFDAAPGGSIDPTDLLGFNSSEESDAAGLVRTDDSGDPGTKDHKVWIGGNDDTGDDVSFPEVVADNVVGAGRITLALSATGIAAGESFDMTLEGRPGRRRGLRRRRQQHGHVDRRDQLRVDRVSAGQRPRDHQLQDRVDPRARDAHPAGGGRCSGRDAAEAGVVSALIGLSPPVRPGRARTRRELQPCRTSTSIV